MKLPESGGINYSRFEGVDVLRGMAALTVVLSHYFPYWNRYFENIWVMVPSNLGYQAVKLFFIVSGFVIFLTLDRCKTLTDFAVSRFSRLYPTYWATLLFVTACEVVVLSKNIWMGGLLSNLTMFQEFIGFINLDIVYWSLTVELAFYVNAAWLFALGYHSQIRKLVFVWLAVSCVWALTGHNPETDDRHWLALIFVLDYSPYFSIGILLYDAVKNGWSRFKIALISLALFTEFLLASWPGVIVACVALSLMLLAVHGYLKFLVNRFTLWLGTISFALYLVHRKPGYMALTWMREHNIDPYLSVAVVTLAALILASMFTYALERPASKWIRGNYKRRFRKSA